MMPAPLRRLVGPDLTFRHAAWMCVLAGAGLSAVGVAAIDLTEGTAPAPSGAPLGLHALALKQAVFVLVGVLAAVCAAVPHYRYVRLVAWPAMWGVLALLVFLLAPGVPDSLVTPRNGVRGWIDLGPIDFQPAEVAKIAFVLVAAEYMRYRTNHRRLTGLLPPAIIAFVPMALIILQPDLGTASLFLPALFAILLAAGAKLKHLTAVVLLAATAGPAAYPLLKPHQKQRIIGMIRLIEGSREGADSINYQSITAMTLGGAGGAAGTPEARSRALIRFNALPESHNDMIFAVILNRWGLLGGLGVLALFALWLAGGLLTAALCREPFGRLLAVGFTAFGAAQMFVNVGMTIGLLPIIGVTLPFVSYGGSSMLTMWLMTGLIVNIAMRRPPRLARATFEFGGADEPTRGW